MSRQNIFTKLSIVIALAALLAAGAIWETRRVRASGGFERTFGMVGITRGQTMRLNVVNLTSPPDADRHFPPPCRVVLSFRDADGHPFTNSDGQVIRRVVELQSGESAFLDLNGDMFGPPTTNDAVGPVRTQLRPFVRVLSQPPDPERNLLAPPCFPTMEVFDNASGRTSLFSAGFQALPDPERQ